VKNGWLTSVFGLASRKCYLANEKLHRIDSQEIPTIIIENTMNQHRLLCIYSVSALLIGCASNKQLVTTLAANELKCPESELAITYKGGDFAGTNKYEVHGCNQSRTYVCDRWSYGVSVATTGDSLNQVCEHAW
jgi:hypothetical protein